MRQKRFDLLRLILPLVLASVLLTALPSVAAELSEPVEGTATPSSVQEEIAAIPSLDEVYVDGKRVEITSYKIDGRNYLMLREVGKAVGFNVYWDGEHVQVNTDYPYTGQAPVPTPSPTPEPTPEPTPAAAEPAPDPDEARFRQLFWGLLVLVCLLCALAAWLHWRYVCRPLRDLEDLFLCWPNCSIDDLLRLGRAIDGLPRPAAKAAMARMEELDKKLAVWEEETARRTEESVRERIAREILASALPSPWTGDADRLVLEGMVERTQHPNSVLYDYFFLDAGLLAMVITESPGDDVSTALFMVIAQTTIRSRLRMGRSLEQTMSDVNTQLYDLGEHRPLHALVAILRTEDGRLSYVNAGGCRPLLMRHDERYEWLDDPVFASLGENEKVTYRTMQLRLRQGDRLFFSTAGLHAVRNKEGAPFEREQLQAVLNRSRNQPGELPGMLRFVASEASVWCEAEADRMDYASLMLEYRKGDKDLARCELPAQPQSLPALTGFLKEQLTANHIKPNLYAKLVIITEELFTLCFRRAEKGSSAALECGVAPDGQSVSLRFLAKMGGVDPLSDPRDRSEESAAAFVREQVDFLTFTPGRERDACTIVYFWNREGPVPQDRSALPENVEITDRPAVEEPSGQEEAVRLFGGERGMQIRARSAGSRLVLELEGRLDRTTSPDLEQAVDETIAGVQELIMDFEKIEYISSSGLRVLLTTRLKMGERRFALRNISEFVRDVLSVTGFLDILTVE